MKAAIRDTRHTRFRTFAFYEFFTFAVGGWTEKCCVVCEPDNELFISGVARRKFLFVRGRSEKYEIC